MDKPSVLAIIPARGGSKGIPQKNIKNLGGIPLILWTIKAARNAKCIDEIIVSTDDPDIQQISVNAGVRAPFLRDKKLAQDDSLRNDVIKDVLDRFPGFDYMIFLQPTSPFRKSEQIDDAFIHMFQNGFLSCVSVKEQHPSPHCIFSLEENNKLSPILKAPKNTNRQQAKSFYILNGAIYISSVPSFLNSTEPDPLLNSAGCAYVMNEEDSMDLDTHIQWKVAEQIIQV